MSVKTAGVGHFQIPTAPAPGTSVTSGAANVYTTTPVQLIAATAAALYITGIYAEEAAVSAATYKSVQLMIGAAASETVIGQYLIAPSTGSTVTRTYRPIFPPIPVANGIRISVKTGDSVGALATLISLECIAQSNVVDDGIAITTVTTVTNQLTAAAIATGVWQDATAGDFTTASSIGKCLFISNVVPGAAGGHFIAGTNAATTITTGLTTTFTGNLTGSAASVTGAVGSVTAAVTVGTISNNVITAASINADAITAAKIADGAIDAATFAAGAINAAAIAADAITDAKVAADVTIASVTGNVGGNVVGSVASVVGAVGSVTGLTAANLDVAVSTRLATAGYTAPLSASATANAVWDELQALHLTVGTVGLNQSLGAVAGLDAAGVRAAVGLAAANLDTQIAAVKGDTAAIKPKTDSLNFTVAGKLDINVLYVNGVQVIGAGTVGSPWGPA